MEQCYRIALWMFLLIGYLQAFPVTNDRVQCKKRINERWHFRMNEQPFDDLFEEVKCGTLTFTSPPRETDNCQKALNCFMEDLRNVKQSCNGTQRIDLVLDFLTLPSAGETSAACEGWENTKHQNFTAFKENLKGFAEWVNSAYN